MSTHSRRTGSEELRRAALASNATGLRAQRVKRRMVRRLRKVAAAGLSLTAYERDRKDQLELHVWTKALRTETQCPKPELPPSASRGQAFL